MSFYRRVAPPPFRAENLPPRRVTPPATAADAALGCTPAIVTPSASTELSPWRDDLSGVSGASSAVGGQPSTARVAYSPCALDGHDADDAAALKKTSPRRHRRRRVAPVADDTTEGGMANGARAAAAAAAAHPRRGAAAAVATGLNRAPLRAAATPRERAIAAALYPRADTGATAAAAAARETPSMWRCVRRCLHDHASPGRDSAVSGASGSGRASSPTSNGRRGSPPGRGTSPRPATLGSPPRPVPVGTASGEPSPTSTLGSGGWEPAAASPSAALREGRRYGGGRAAQATCRLVERAAAAAAMGPERRDHSDPTATVARARVVAARVSAPPPPAIPAPVDWE